MAELDKMEEMEKALGAGVMIRSSAEQTGPAEEPKAQTEEFTRKFFLKTSGGDMVDLLDTNPLVMAARAETSSYSITPKTFQSRTFFGEAESSGGEEKESLAGLSSSHARAAEEPTYHQRSLTYIDKFAFGSNAVVRFGINSRNVAVDNERQTLEGESVTFYSSDSSATSQSSTRSSRQSSQKPEAIKALAEAVVHHPLEIHLITESIRYLFDEESRKTVLVDIFARKEGSINLQNQEVTVVTEDGSESNSTITIPETHTIVLYKNPPSDGKHTVLVIDPSSFAFSSHLSNLSTLLVSIFPDYLREILTIHAGTQIYKSPKDSEGPRYDQYRDCIDVAAKIAFGLNALNEYNSYTDIESIKECPTIQHLSNQKIDGNILFPNLPVRVKQTSDIQLVSIFCETQREVNTNFKTLSLLGQNPSKNDCKPIFIPKEKSPITIIEELVGQNASYVKKIEDFANTVRAQHDCLSEEISLLGGEE